MIQSIKLQADKLKITMKPADVAIGLLAAPFWLLGWIAGVLWHIATLVVAALIVGFKAGRG